MPMPNLMFVNLKSRHYKLWMKLKISGCAKNIGM